MKTTKPKPKAKKSPTPEPLDTNEVLKVLPDKRVFMGANEITPIEVKNLQEEVRALKNFRIWKVMQETVKQKAIDKGFYEALSWEETLSGKMMVHNLGILKSIVDVIDRYQPPVVPPKTQTQSPLK